MIELTNQHELLVACGVYSGCEIGDGAIEVIDGRKMSRSHGTNDMPVWGERLYEGGRESSRLADVRRGTILRIIEYLNAIQVDVTGGTTR